MRGLDGVCGPFRGGVDGACGACREGYGGVDCAWLAGPEGHALVLRTWTAPKARDSSKSADWPQKHGPAQNRPARC